MIVELVPEVQFYTNSKTKITVDYVEYRKIFNEELERRWQNASKSEREEKYDNNKQILHCYMSDFEEFDLYYPSDKLGNTLLNE